MQAVGEWDGEWLGYVGDSVTWNMKGNEKSNETA